MVVGVTGASGYIGRAVVQRLRLDGHVVVAIGRSPVEQLELRFADLKHPVSAGLTSGLDVVMHLAADTGRGDPIPFDAEVAFAGSLFDDALRQGCRILFVSSQAASPDAPSSYGRVKHAIESLALAHRGIVVRPGLVYGGRAAGLYGLLVGLVARCPVVPELCPPPGVNPVHVDDVATALARAMQFEGPATFRVAGPRMGLGDLLAAIAHHRLHVHRPRIPVPVALVRAALMVMVRLLGAAFAPERLDSLLRLVPMEAADDVRRLGIVLRPLEAGLTRGTAWRRDILREAALLGRAVLGAHAPESMLRRYARMLERGGLPPHAALRRLRPWQARALDRPGTRAGAAVGSIEWRLDLATRLAEAQPQLAQRFIVRAPGSGRFVALVALAHAALLEAIIVLSRPLVTRRHPPDRR